MEFERGQEAIRWIAWIRALRFTEGWRVRPEASLRAYYARLAHQRMSFGATEGDEGAYCVPALVISSARSIDSPINRH